MAETAAGGGRRQLRLNSAEATRRSLARVVRLYDRGEIPDWRYRGLVYGINSLLGYWKLEADLRIEERLDELEARLEKAGTR